MNALVNFRLALSLLYSGHKVKLPEWQGYWYVKEDGLIWVHTYDDQDLPTPWFKSYIDRCDWQVVE